MSIVPLFWTSDYARIHGDDHQLIETASGLLSVGRAGSEILKSPGRATFGGFWIEPSTVFTYTEKTIQQIKDYGKTSSQIRISFPPEHFHPEVFQDQITLLTKYCSTLIPESNFHIVVDNRNEVSKGNRKKQRQFSERGGSVSQVEKSDWLRIYKLLEQNRLRRGVALSMPWHIFERGLIDRPDAFTIWGATLESELVGGALTVEIDSNFLYVLFWGDTLLGRDISVVASICEKLIEFCTIKNYKVLDLGISSVDGLLDENLAKFKVNLGAVKTTKPILTLRFP
jgi:hypothetical protein